jgi:hypothetical protein
MRWPSIAQNVRRTIRAAAFADYERQAAGRVRTAKRLTGGAFVPGMTGHNSEQG